jgi:hypothetical protein
VDFRVRFPENGYDTFYMLKITNIVTVRDDNFKLVKVMYRNKEINKFNFL